MMRTNRCSVFSHNALHRSDDLLHHRRRHGGGVHGAVGVAAQVIDELLQHKPSSCNRTQFCSDGPARLGSPAEPHPLPCDVTPCGSEALGEGSHHDVHVSRVEAEVIHHASPPGAQGADAMGLVQVQVGPVAPLQGDHLRQPHYTALHAAGTNRGRGQQVLEGQNRPI